MTPPAWAGAIGKVAAATFGDGASVRSITRLSSGASRQTWAIDIVVRGGDEHRCVLQRRSPGGLGVTTDIDTEADLLGTAGQAGVPVPAVLASGRDDGLGAPWMLMSYVAGEAIPRRVLRRAASDDAMRTGLVADLGRAAARIASIDPASVRGLRLHRPIEDLRLVADLVAPLPPAFEAAFSWLSVNRPDPVDEPVVVHGDFRLGNVLVDDSGLTAVLDWELAHLGHPVEDLAWLCVRAWRFGAAEPAGGVGERSELWAAFEREGGPVVAPATVHWWEVHGTLRWGLISMVQAQRHLSGRERSLELAAIGRRVCETEWDLLLLLDPEGEPALPEPVCTDLHPGPTSPHHAPSAIELVEEVRHLLVEGDLGTEASGRARYQARVAANALAIVARELRHADQSATRSPASSATPPGDRPQAADWTHDDVTSAAIADRSVTWSDRAVLDRMWQAAARRVAVANPAWPT
ncbi:MAG TPA: phosphotransferase [Acidimicrobiales bacterium]